MKVKHSPLAAVLAASLALFASGVDEAQAQAAPFTLSSPDLPGNAFPVKFILNGFGCAGANTSPALIWSNVPAGTKSLSLQVHDPDAPTGSGFWHWAVYDMPPTTAGLAQGAGNAPTSLPAGAYGGNTDFVDTGATGGNGNYGGPCPPQGDRPHRYVFTVHALKVDRFDVPAGASPAMVGYFLGMNRLGQATLEARYGR